jgi:hypothetical protein
MEGNMIMRKAALGMSVAVFAGLALTACGDQPEPMAPVEPSFDRTTESTDAADPMIPETGTDTVPPVGSEPGEIPEVMEDETYGDGDTTTEMMGDPEQPADETGTPQ